ncbi:MAG: tetratricopeptide repeat protein [Planctomycetia bacterium]|nr:tetratricopeptide repeat protein [Planctomycetia bacterium]
MLTVLLYGRVIAYDFVNFDDDAHVYQNPQVQSGLSWSGLQWAFTIHGPSQWHPIAWLSHQLDWQLFGNHPAGHHATNLWWHVCGTVLLFFAVDSLLGRPQAAAFVAAMFAVHPLNVESVAWISERRNVLCGVFWMLAILAYARYARQGGFTRYLAVTFWFTLALMAKPLAVTLPCVFALLDYWPLRRCPLLEPLRPTAAGCRRDPCPSRSWSLLLMEKFPWLLLSCGASWLSYRCQASIQVVSSWAALPLGLRIENACVAYGLYLRRMIWPSDLAVFYPHPAWHDPHPARILLVPAIGSGVILAIVTGIVVWRMRRNPGLAIGWFWFLGTMVPMIGLVQVGQQQLADRYIYIPMIGLGLLAVTVPFPAVWTPAVRRLAVLAVTIWFGMSFWHLDHWRNSKTLFTRAIAVTRNNSWAHHNLGYALHGEGDHAGAIENYQRALAIDPNYALAHFNLGSAWQDIGQLDSAIQHFEWIVIHDDRHVDAWVRLGAAEGQAQRFDRAERCFRKAISLDSRAAQARFNLAIVLDVRNETAESLANFRDAVTLVPDDVQFRTGWMLALAKNGRFAEARDQAREVLRREPGSQAARRLLAQ